MFFAIGLGWWLSGFLTAAWLGSPVLDWTWGNLAQAVLLGFGGPIIAVVVFWIIGFSMLRDAKFWSRRIFRRRG